MAPNVGPIFLLRNLFLEFYLSSAHNQPFILPSFVNQFIRQNCQNVQKKTRNVATNVGLQVSTSKFLFLI